MKAPAGFLLILFHLIRFGDLQLLENLARNKPTKQSSNTASYTADLAVNGDFTDFSHTHELPNQWWKVDLGNSYTIGVVELVNREGFYHRLSNISILTSTNRDPPDPISLSNDGTRRVFNSPWTEQSYQKAAYGAVAVISLPNVSVRHLAVYNLGQHGVTLKEVNIYQSTCWNLADRKPSIQSTLKTPSQYGASFGNDGVIPVSNGIEGLSITEERVLQWWRVDLGLPYFVYKVVIFGRVDCCQERYTGWSVLTSNRNVNAASGTILQIPPWKVQATITGQVGAKTEQIFTADSAQHVAVISSNSWGIILRELQVFGCQSVIQDALNEFSMMTSSLQPGCVTVSLNWTNNNCNDQVFTYEYLCDGHLTWTSTGRVNSSDVCYQLSGRLISCQMKVCLGSYCSYTNRNASTALCTDPSQPELLSFRTGKLPSGYIDLFIIWKAAKSNCYGEVLYNLSLNGPGDTRSFQLTDTNKTISQLDPCLNYSISITASNNQMMSSTANLTISSVNIELSNNLNQFNVTTSLKPGCVTVSWSPSQTKCTNAAFSYEYLCGDQQTWIRRSIQFSDDVCFFSSGKRVTCQAKACSLGDCTVKNITGMAATCTNPANVEAYSLQQNILPSGSVDAIISWKTPESNCYGDVLYNISVRGADEVGRFQLSEPKVTLQQLDACANYTLHVIAMNNENMVSTSRYIFITLHKESRNFSSMTLSVANSTCLQLDWRLHEVPDVCFPRTITGWCYQTTDQQVSVKINQPAASKPLFTCGFRDSSLVMCRLQTIDQNGYHIESFTVQVISGQEPWILPVAVVVPLVTLIAVAAAVSIWLIRRSQPLPRDGKSSLVMVVSDIYQSMESNVETNIYENSTEIEATTAVEIEKLQLFIQEKSEKIKLQFEKLTSANLASTSVATRPENKGKNKYKGLYPADQWRIALDKRETKDGSDYINASFMRGYKQENKYIAAQGPLKKTVDDFWLMIWQEKISAVVMLTKTEEAGKSKCEKYWPDEKETELFDKISVKSLLAEDWADFTIRTLQVSKAEESRVIKQYHFMAWPDSSVPKENFSFVMFYRLVHAYTHNHSSPILIHCSAGVGRTGTFIALDYLMDQARTTGNVDPVSCAQQMRERRPAMIQNEEQYFFLYDVLLETFFVETFVNPANQLQSKLQSFEKLSSKLGDSVILSEFQRISQLISKRKYLYDTGLMTVNRSKNRFQHILPNELCRPFLSPKGQPGGYINAVHVDGYRGKDTILCTQLPLQETVADFLQLAIYHETSVIIQLDEDELKFYPTEVGNICCFNRIQVTCKSLEISDFITTYVLEVEFMMTMYDILLMKVKTRNNSLPDCLLALNVLEAIEKNTQKTDSKAVLFTSLDGAEKCGLFCCAFNALQKLKAEQEVDIYQTVLSARYRRPEFIVSLDEYVWLYRVMAEYVSSFLEYSNFREVI